MQSTEPNSVVAQQKQDQSLFHTTPNLRSHSLWSGWSTTQKLDRIHGTVFDYWASKGSFKEGKR